MSMIMKKQLLGTGIFILILCCWGVLVWGAGQYLKSDGTPNFQKLKSTSNGNHLTAEMRDDLMDGLSKMQQGQGVLQPNTTTIDIPKGAIMAFDLSSCPQWWSRWNNADGRFLMGASSQIGSVGGDDKVHLTVDQLPKHRFPIRIWRRWNDWEHTAGNVIRIWDSKPWPRGEKKETVGYTDYVWEWRAINIQNPYVKVIYCKKN